MGWSRRRAANSSMLFPTSSSGRAVATGVTSGFCAKAFQICQPLGNLRLELGQQLLHCLNFDLLFQSTNFKQESRRSPTGKNTTLSSRFFQSDFDRLCIWTVHTQQLEGSLQSCDPRFRFPRQSRWGFSLPPGGGFSGFPDMPLASQLKTKLWNLDLD